MNKKLTAPTNTRTEAQRDPSLFLARATIFGSSGAILDQESEGQKEMVRSDTLPTKMSAEDKAELERLGAKFMGPVPGDDIFQYVQLPDGWKKVETDHAMWSKLVDDKGSERGSIFYKAAFYDRSARMSLNARYGYGYDTTKDVPTVIDRGEKNQTIFTPESSEYGSAQEECEQWLKTTYPDHQNISAYWN